MVRFSSAASRRYIRDRCVSTKNINARAYIVRMQKRALQYPPVRKSIGEVLHYYARKDFHVAARAAMKVMRYVNKEAVEHREIRVASHFLWMSVSNLIKERTCVGIIHWVIHNYINL